MIKDNKSMIIEKLINQNYAVLKGFEVADGQITMNEKYEEEIAKLVEEI